MINICALQYFVDFAIFNNNNNFLAPVLGNLTPDFVKSRERGVMTLIGALLPKGASPN